jgi:O-antigen ligase
VTVAIARPLAGERVRPWRRSQTTAFWGRALIVLVTLVWASSLVLDLRSVIQILTLAGFVAAVAGLAYPELGLLAIGLLCTLDSISRLYVFSGGFLRWNTLNYLLILVAVLYWRSLRRIGGGPMTLLGTFVLLLTIELGLSPEPYNGVLHLLGIASTFGLLVYVTRAATQEVWPWVGLVAGVVAAEGGAVFFRHGAVWNPNAWAYFPVTALLLACITTAVSTLEPWQRRVLLVLSGVNLGWAFLSTSRGGFLTASVAAAFIFFGGQKRNRARAWGAVVLLVTMGVTALFGDVQTRMTAKLTKLLDTSRSAAGRTSGRSDLALAGWDVFLENPLGVGTGGFAASASVLGERERLEFYDIHSGFQAHSAWVKTLAENGLPGILLFAAFVGSFIVVGYRRRHDGLFGLGALTTTVLAIAFLSTEFQPKGLWILSAASLFVLRRARRVTGRDVSPPRTAGGPFAAGG